jgi:hypothetical protein
MPSPFPGMDPWLERPGLFPDLHDSLIGYLRDALGSALPEGYAARGANLVWVEDDQRRKPDVGIFGDSPSEGGDSAAGIYSELGMVAVLAEPIAEPWTETYLEILDIEGDRLVTALEILSLSNKTGSDRGRGAYLQKQGEFRRTGVNLVEIDLLRGGLHTTAVPKADLARLGRPDYHVRITLAGESPRHEVKPIRLADRLPRIAVPLDPGVPPVVVDLQPLLDRAYDLGRYQRSVRYSTVVPVPPLTPEQQAWAEGILQSKGVR